jgi:hypothetical protein
MICDLGRSELTNKRDCLPDQYVDEVKSMVWICYPTGCVAGITPTRADHVVSLPHFIQVWWHGRRFLCQPPRVQAAADLR